MLDLEFCLGMKDEINKQANEMIETNIIRPATLRFIISACNFIYNNFPNQLPLISDETYDKLMVLAKVNNIEVPVGSAPADIEYIPVEFNNAPIIRDSNGLLEIVRRVPDYSNMQFSHVMTSNMTPPNANDFIRVHDNTLVERKQRTTAHTYDLCGTLDKCKYTLNIDAFHAGAINDPSVAIFERDFLMPHIQSGLINPNFVEVIVSLKYDGISVENTILGDEIISSITRGDLSTNEATNLTPIFGGMKFARAAGMPRDREFAIKFEYIITDENKRAIERIFGKSYVNLRNAVIGLVGGLDARMYRDYLTPIPLESSLPMNRVDEIQWLNRYYTKGIDFRWTYISGDVNTVLSLVNQFVKEADVFRDYMGFAYDGIVVELANSYVRNSLGKRGPIPRYATAIKFDPLRKISTFTHYEFTVGQDGSITPIAYFEPVEFFGAIHNKTTAHSYKKFQTLGLHIGDKVTLTLNNDVIVYIRRAPDCEQDPYNPNPLYEFPTHCPSCGQPLYFSDTGDSVYCVNINCPERNISRMSNCLKKLSLKDFSTETVRALQVHSLGELYNYPFDLMVQRIGPTNAQNLVTNLNKLKEANLSDARLIGAIGFTNMAEKTWRSILEQFPIERVLNCPIEDFRYLRGIDGIGNATIQTIMDEREYFLNDLLFIFSTFKYTKTPPYNPNAQRKPKVCFTGFRDAGLEDILRNSGYEITNSVTKDLAYLIVPHEGGTSTKIAKVFKLLSQAYSVRTGQPPLQVSWGESLNLCRSLGLSPQILTVDQVRSLWI